MKHKGKCQNVNQYLAVSSSFTIFEGTFVSLLLTFSMLNSPVKPRNSRFCNHKITAHLATDCFYCYYLYIIFYFFYFRYFKALFP